VVANLSGSPITIGRAEDRKLMARSTSARTQAAYVYAAAGEGESTTDLAWDGQTFVYECGDLLGETERFPQGPRATVADIDLDRLVAERRRMSTFDDNRRTHAQRLERYEAQAGTRLFGPFLAADGTLTDLGVDGPSDIHGGPEGLEEPADEAGTGAGWFAYAPLSGTGYDPARLAQDCYEAFSIQVAGLVRRLSAIGGDTPGGTRPVLGVSGGLDSTHALLVCARAMDVLGRD